MKKNMVLPALLVSLVSCLIGCSTSRPNTITQFSTIGAILAGAYDGQATCKELMSYGDLGIGTFDRLDGEMILLNGKCHQVKADGRVYKPAKDLTTPYASAVEFDEDITIAFNKKTDLARLEKIVNQAAPNTNIFCALKLKGRFLKMKTRSVTAQKKPYPPLVEVTRRQSVFELENVSGTIVGFRAPDYAKAITMPGFHLHFISDDAESGGHVLEFMLEKGTAEIDICNRFLMILPEDDGAFGDIDLSRDRSSDLEEAER